MSRYPMMAERLAVQRNTERMASHVEPEDTEGCRWGEPDADGFRVCLTRRLLKLAVGVASDSGNEVYYRRAFARWSQHECEPMPRGGEDHGLGQPEQGEPADVATGEPAHGGVSSDWESAGARLENGAGGRGFDSRTPPGSPVTRSHLDVLDHSRLWRLHFEAQRAAFDMCSPRASESEIEAYHKAERAFEEALKALGDTDQLETT